MKKSNWTQGFMAGSISGVLLSVLLLGQQLMAHGNQQPAEMAVRKTIWPDSLDAVKAAPGNHKIVFENSKVRVLEVTGEPYVREPVHTHPWPSIMWMADSNFSKAKLMYYHCAWDAAKKRFYDIDSSLEKGPPPNIGFEIPAEGPHRVTNLSNLPLTAYRIEFKQ